jgi:hypothetical protein
MILKRGKSACTLVVIFILFFVGQLTAQMNPIYRFKKVAIPVELRIDDSILPKGAYDLEFLRANPLSYYLRIMKQGKILHLIQGEGVPYDDPKTIPEKPTLKMSKDKDQKSLIIVFESGYRTNIYGKLRARYRLEYKED